MKIQNDGLQGTNPLEAGRTQGTQHPSGAAGLNGRTVSGYEGDTVQISGISQHLAESNAVDAQQRESRVAQLASQYAKGQYHVNAAALSAKIVSGSIGAAAPGGGTK